MDKGKGQGTSGTSLRNPKWGLWRRDRAQTSGKFPAEGAWERWQHTGKVFDDDEYSNHEDWIRKYQSNDHQWKIEPE
ncbi:MAG TPA: hypothetical protein VJH03_21615 [Blastocatellia bacterium]|nr:hypothetical protein [Blastocatellia bacterium]